METQTKLIFYLLLSIGIAVILFSATPTAPIAEILTIKDRPSLSGYTDNAKLAALEQLSTNTVPVAVKAPLSLIELPVTNKTYNKVACLGCGVIESIREIGNHCHTTGINAAGVVDWTGLDCVLGEKIKRNVKSSKKYEIIIRMNDGSSRMINDATPAIWRVGERIIVIDAEPSKT